MKKNIINIGLIVFVLVALLFMAGCGESTPEAAETEDIKELVYNYSVGNIEAASASINSEQLIVTESDDTESTYELPEDEFFVSIAPYENETHPCAIHSLTGCQGEMVEEEFDVYIEDTEGNVVVDETMTTQANGFIDLWLPRDKTYHVSIEHDGKTTEAEISTFKDDNTCITTMQL